MHKKQAERPAGRVTIGALLEEARRSEGNGPETSVRNLAQRFGRGMFNCRVDEFCNTFLCETYRIGRGTFRKEREEVQKWISCCTEAMFDEASASMTMGELASKIASSVNRTDLSPDDRWALYELCFMLTSVMSRVDAVFPMEERCSRIGTPDEEETGSLYRRASFAGVIRKKRKPKPLQKVSIGELLDNVKAESIRLPVEELAMLPSLRVSDFLWRCLSAKHDLDPASDEDEAEFAARYDRFAEMVNMYSERGWSGEISIADFAERITFRFKVSSAKRTPPRHKVLQAYELCYEFITLMADEESCRGHESLMKLEGLDGRYDLDLPVSELTEEDLTDEAMKGWDDFIKSGE